MTSAQVPQPPLQTVPHSRWIGFMVALGIAAAVAIIETLASHTQVTALGLFVAPYLGWNLGPDAAAFRRPVRTIFEMAGMATLFGALLLAMFMMVTPLTSTSIVDLVAGVFVFAGLGLLIYGLPALVVTSICAWAWYHAVLRLTGGHGSSEVDGRAPSIEGAIGQ